MPSCSSESFGKIHSAEDPADLVIAFVGRLRRRSLVVGLKHRATAAGELRRVLLQGGQDAVGIGNLAAAEPSDIRRAGHLLFPGAAIFLRVRRLHRDDADRERKIKRDLPTRVLEQDTRGQ